ncbi:MAG: hypothetical protein ACOVQ2_04475 [Flavobacterium sp.]
MKKIILLFILTISLNTFAQNKYKYAIIPLKYSIFKIENQYNINTNSKKMMESYGLETYFENQFPDHYNTCEAIKLDLEENNSMFTTKIKIVFKDCKNQIIYKSDEGISKEKEFKIAYNEALRNASRTIEKFDFILKNKNNESELKNGNKEDIKIYSIKKPEVNHSTIPTKESEINKNIPTKDVLKFQYTSNGYYLLNNNQEKVLQLFKTSNPSIFIAKNNEYQGVASISLNTCTVEYYQNDQLISKTYHIE